MPITVINTTDDSETNERTSAYSTSDCPARLVKRFRKAASVVITKLGMADGWFGYEDGGGNGLVF